MNKHGPHNLRSSILCAAGLLGWSVVRAFSADCGVFVADPLPAQITPRSYAVALADFNKDGNLDAYVGNDGPDQVFFMATNGFFPIMTDSGQRLGSGLTCGAAAGDLNGDSNADVFVTSEDGGRVWYNNGAGLFTNSALIVTNPYCTAAAIGDLNGDGHNDIFVCRGNAAFGFKDVVITNNGGGVFSPVEQPAFIQDRSFAVALGDLDNDGDLDAYVANSVANRCYRNDGQAHFSLWGADSRNDDSRGAAIADMNGDGWKDVVVAKAWPGASQVYLNRTGGVLEPCPLDADINDALGVAVADFDGDLRPDIATVGWVGQGVWFNVDGTNYSRALQPMGSDLGQAVAAGDVNGDAAVDLLAVNYSCTNTLWLNQCLPEHVMLWILSRYGPSGSVSQAFTNEKNSLVTRTMANFVENGQTQYACTGWTLRGNDPSSGAGASAVFTQTNNALLVWEWSANYWLDTTGSRTQPTSSWQAAGSQVVVTGYSTRDYYHFDYWTGSVPSGGAYSNPLALLMDEPKVLTVNLAPNLAANETPEWWLAVHGWTTNFDAAALADQDGDRVPSWEEYRSDTVPTNSDSYLRLISIPREGGAMARWAGGTGVIQYLEWNTGLVENAAWTILRANPPPTPITNEWPAPTAASQAFFRVRAVR